jgi:hypothetical protein
MSAKANSGEAGVIQPDNMKSAKISAKIGMKWQWRSIKQWRKWRNTGVAIMAVARHGGWRNGAMTIMT